MLYEPGIDVLPQRILEVFLCFEKYAFQTGYYVVHGMLYGVMDSSRVLARYIDRFFGIGSRVSFLDHGHGFRDIIEESLVVIYLSNESAMSDLVKIFWDTCGVELSISHCVENFLAHFAT